MRISRDMMFMDMARVVAKRSTCFRLNVGAILVRSNTRILSMGYNGQLSGESHCSSICSAGECNTIHAEENALSHANGECLRDTTLYCTDSPCARCVTMIIARRVPRVAFSTPYRNIAPLIVLNSCGINVDRILPSGAIVGRDEYWGLNQ